MGTNVIESVLGNNTFYTREYLEQSIALIKSIAFKSKAEASGYNDHVKKTYPGFVVSDNKDEWRYYLHLSGRYHAVDQPVMVTSVDNGTQIEVTKVNMGIHRKTRTELLKFGQLYDEVVSRYPEQQLYIKTVISDSPYTGVDQLWKLPDFTIICHNSALIEENEIDLMLELQQRIDNYKSIWLIQFYAAGYTLFLASQYHIFYNFLLTSLLAIRLENTQTVRAHSYHIRLFLASHHKLDDHLLFLTKKQQLFLYRNMLYLNNHSGHNSTFQKLIDVLFTDRNISVTNYQYRQRNSVDADGHIDYLFDRKLLNSRPMLHENAPIDLPALGEKERPLVEGNQKAYTYKYDQIDSQNKRSLFSKLLTKDLETVLVDETDSVKYKLIDTLVDYWAYLNKTDMVAFLVDVTDPVTNVTKRLNTKDLFKLYSVSLHKQQGISLSEFPSYRIKRVFNPVKPTAEQLTGFFYKQTFDQLDYIEEIREAIPMYSNLLTSYQFADFVSRVYRLNIGLWHMLTNFGDMDTNGQMTMTVDNFHITDVYTFDDESVDDFFRRTGVTDVRTYDNQTLTGYLFNILDNVFDQKLSYLNRLKRLQGALTDVFSKFNSYTVQLLNNYYSDSPILSGLEHTRYSIESQAAFDLSDAGTILPSLSIEVESQGTREDVVNLALSPDLTSATEGVIQIDLIAIADASVGSIYEIEAGLPLPEIEIGDQSHKSESTAGLNIESKVLEVTSQTYSDSDVLLEVGVSVETEAASESATIVNFNVGFTLEESLPPPQELSEEHFLFLAMNL